MTGTNHPGAYVPLSGANLIDSLTFGTKFSDASNPTIYYGFSLNRGNYGSYSADPNHVSELPSFSAVTGGVVELRDTDGDVLVLKNITLAQLGQDDFYFG